jgi:hypothetical protein
MSVGSCDVAQPTWTPANETESAMAGALATGNSQAYFRALAGATLYLPALDEPGPQQLVTVRSGDDQYVLVFTSTEALASRLRGVPAFRTTTCAELLDKWPDPALMLAVDPETPIQAYAPIRVVADGAAGRLDLTPAVAVPGGPVNALEAELDQAVRESDVDALIGALVSGVVLMPTDGERWAPAAEQTIAVFTSPERAAAAVPGGTPLAELAFLDIALDWPGIGWRLVVNPGESALEFTGAQVLGFVEWARHGVDAAGADLPAVAVATALVQPLPAEMAEAYLVGHRSDISGLVHRESDLATVPIADVTHVLHWVQHCSEVCLPVRVPDEAPAAWRLTAVQVPHGAKLEQVGDDGRRSWVAAYDADLSEWLPLPDPDRMREALRS